MQWYPVIGLEVHVQLDVAAKLFSTASTRYGAKANSQASYIDLGLPGTLPVVNRQAIEQAVRFGFATGSTVNHSITFDRKNYYYPDLPKGYQITQHHNPILKGGHIDIQQDSEKTKRIRIHHTHLEEDAGKSSHNYRPNKTGIDLNRAGMPLLEVVSEPDMRSAQEAVSFLKALHSLVVFLGVCDGNMQEGSMRCDANISIRNDPNGPFGTRVEIKNINSFKYVEKAILYEIMRQAEILESNGTITQQTRLFSESTGTTKLMREKEQVHDYRYFPEPDIPEIRLPDEEIDLIRKQLPELPDAKMQRYIETYQLSSYDARLLAYDKHYAHYFDTLLKENPKLSPKLVANWLLGPVAAALNRNSSVLTEDFIGMPKLATLLVRIEEEVISNNIAKNIFEDMLTSAADADTIITQKNLRQISSTAELGEIIQTVISKHPDQVSGYRNGNPKLFGFLVGQCMKLSQGKAHPSRLNELLRQELDG